MTGPNGAQLLVNCDLDVRIADQQARVIADGHQIEVSVEEPGRFLAALAGGARSLPVPNRPLRATIAELGAQLNGAGLSLEVSGAAGPVIAVGSGCTSTVGRVLLNTRHARLGSWRAVAPATAGYLRKSFPAVGRWVVIGASVSAMVTLAVRRNRHLSTVPAA